MKKFAAILMMALLPTMLFAQALPKEHLTFRGYPISGSMKEFKTILTTKLNYELLETDDDFTLYTGKFGGDNVKLIVYPNSKGNVYQVVVIYDVNDTWSTLTRQYNYWKDIIEDKYEVEGIETKEFDELCKEGSNMEIYGIKNDRVTYRCDFDVKNGRIAIAAIALPILGVHLGLAYIDGIGEEEKQAEAYDDF